MTKLFRYFVTLSFVFFFLSGKAQHESTTPQSSLTESIDSLLLSLSLSGNLNGSVLVAKGKNIIYQESFGYASGDKKEALTKNHKFNIGSIYKELPAIAIMQLQEKGKLDVNDPTSKYLPTLPEWSKNIAIINLLQYTSGLPTINWGNHKIIDDKSLMEDLNEIIELEFVPGNDYLYTNYSPFLLSKIIESISGHNFSKYIENNILKPFGMNQSQFKESFPYNDRDLMAVPVDDEYVDDKLPFEIKASSLLFSTTAEDLFKLLTSLHTFQIINEMSLETIAKSAPLNIENVQSPLGDVDLSNGKIIDHNHHGSSGNFEALISKNNRDEITVIILTNRKKGNLFDIKNKLREMAKK